VAGVGVTTISRPCHVKGCPVHALRRTSIASSSSRPRLLGEADRVVERHEDGGDVDPDPRRAAEHRGGDGERRRQVAVGRAVVLREDDAVEPHAVGPLGHVEGRGVLAGVGRLREVRHPEVEAQPEHGHRAPPSPT